jgi:BirA family biotin operon repressor/biotin-[acetyl-CoA-carboxylase] ligase
MGRSILCQILSAVEGRTLRQLTPEAITQGLQTRFVGQQVLYYPSIWSTNQLAKRLAVEGAPAGTTIVADEQTAGRGRMGRVWLAPPGTSLLLSVILRPTIAVGRLPQLLMASALATASAVERSTGLSVLFKWPNDIMLRRGKAGGILIESGMRGEVLDYAVVGIGLNVNFDVGEFPEIVETATSLSKELGHRVDRLELVRALLRLLESEHERLQAGQSPHQRWADRLMAIGEALEISTPWGEERGTMEGVDAEGSLVLRRADGSIARITVGDVS